VRISTGAESVNVYKKLETLGIALSDTAIPVAFYTPFVRSGDLVFLSGHLAKKGTQRYGLADSVTE